MASRDTFHPDLLVGDIAGAVGLEGVHVSRWTYCARPSRHGGGMFGMLSNTSAAK